MRDDEWGVRAMLLLFNIRLTPRSVPAHARLTGEKKTRKTGVLRSILIIYTLLRLRVIDFPSLLFIPNDEVFLFYIIFFAARKAGGDI